MVIVDGQVVPLGRRPEGQRRRSAPVETVTVVCGRSKCRREFIRSLHQRGRRKDYCSEECRRLVDAERRRTRARLKHYEQTVQRLKADLAAYPEATDSADAEMVAVTGGGRRALTDALMRAEGVIAGAGPHNRVAIELAVLVNAVRGYLDSDDG